MAVYCYSMTGSCDNLLKWPIQFTITLELLNQERDQDHIRVSKTFFVTSPIDADKGYVISIRVPIPDSNSEIFIRELSPNSLEYNAKKKTCYLKNDSLLFRVEVSLC